MSEEKNNDKEYLKDLAPLLFSKKQDEARKVPEGYFESLEDQVMAKIKQEEVVEPKGKVRRLINFRNLAIAAGLALLMALIPFLKEPSPDEVARVEVELESISEDAVQLYLVEEYDLESIAADISFESIDISDNEEFSEEEILNYLLDSEISESLIYESL